MGMLHSNKIQKSYGGYSYYYSNKNISEYLRKKRNKLQLESNGFKIIKTSLNRAIELEKQKNFDREKWNFTQDFNGKNFDKMGYKDKKKIVSTFGQIEFKYKYFDGALYIYHKKSKVNNLNFKVYVFIDNNRIIKKCIWYLA